MDNMNYLCDGAELGACPTYPVSSESEAPSMGLWFKCIFHTVAWFGGSCGTFRRSGRSRSLQVGFGRVSPAPGSGFTLSTSKSSTMCTSSVSCSCHCGWSPTTTDAAFAKSFLLKLSKIVNPNRSFPLKSEFGNLIKEIWMWLKQYHKVICACLLSISVTKCPA